MSTTAAVAKMRWVAAAAKDAVTRATYAADVARQCHAEHWYAATGIVTITTTKFAAVKSMAAIIDF